MSQYANPLRIFIGYDHRQPLAAQVLMHSIYRRASRPVSITPLVLQALPVKRRGLTEFTYSRYLVPMLCDFLGDALFLDADMLCLGDVYEIEELCRPTIASVFVVKNKLRFEWPSMMYFKNSLCRRLDAYAVETTAPQSFEWASAGVGELPPEWNHLVGYDEPRGVDAPAKLVHFTQGIPCWNETNRCEYAKEWAEEWRSANGTVTWQALMGNSVHAQHMGRDAKAAA